jgi:hypothetical protein
MSRAGKGRRIIMARTNEDAVVLASVRLDDDRLLILRQLPDRGTVEIGWWQRDEAGSPQQAQVLELAAEAVEVEAFADLCRQALDADWARAGTGRPLAEAGPFTDGAGLAVSVSGDEVTLTRHPEPCNQIRMPRAALQALVAALPQAMEKLTTQGFGLPQQSAGQ